MSDAQDEAQANEAWYDAEIAPVLLELSRKCQARKGVNFLAHVEYAKGDVGQTRWYDPESASISTHMAFWASASHGNIDKFLVAAMRYAKKHGHGSVFLAALEKEFPSTPPAQSPLSPDAPMFVVALGP